MPWRSFKRPRTPRLSGSSSGPGESRGYRTRVTGFSGGWGYRFSGERAAESANACSMWGPATARADSACGSRVRDPVPVRRFPHCLGGHAGTSAQGEGRQLLLSLPGIAWRALREDVRHGEVCRCASVGDALREAAFAGAHGRARCRTAVSTSGAGGTGPIVVSSERRLKGNPYTCYLLRALLLRCRPHQLSRAP